MIRQKRARYRHLKNPHSLRGSATLSILAFFLFLAVSFLYIGTALTVFAEREAPMIYDLIGFTIFWPMELFPPDEYMKNGWYLHFIAGISALAYAVMVFLTHRLYCTLMRHLQRI